MIEYPDLEIRNEDRLAAEAIARVSGGLTAEIVKAQIAERQEILKLIEDGGLVTPICPELTNANPSAPHTVLLEAFAWQLAQLAYRFNRVPKQNLIAFANLFGVERRAAAEAETILRFTVSAPLNTNVTIPIGTQVSDADGNYIFETTEQKTINYGTATGDVTAKRTVTGHTLLAPNLLTKMLDSIAYVTAVTNPNAVDSGTELETVDSALSRVKRYQRRGERIVSVKDLEDAILDEALLGNGIVRAFPFVENGEFDGELKAGYTSVIVMTSTGEIIDDNARRIISALVDQQIGNQFVYIVNPDFVEFDIEFDVRLKTGVAQGAVLTAIENNLRDFYAAARENFGRGIFRSEIIAVVEATSGVDRIVTSGSRILASPSADMELQEYQLPKLVDVTINVV
jgi:hypothetical protein